MISTDPGCVCVHSYAWMASVHWSDLSHINKHSDSLPESLMYLGMMGNQIMSSRECCFYWIIVCFFYHCLCSLAAEILFILLGFAENLNKSNIKNTVFEPVVDVCHQIKSCTPWSLHQVHHASVLTCSNATNRVMLPIL